jgi:hypothetical protein
MREFIALGIIAGLLVSRLLYLRVRANSRVFLVPGV